MMVEGLWNTPISMEGRSVRLEPLAEAHVHALSEVGCDERIWKLMVYDQIRTEEDMRKWVLTMLSRQAAGTDIPFAVIHLATGRVAGATRYMEIRPAHKGLEIGGTWYGLEFQHTIVNTECKYLLLRYAFETLGTIRVQFKADLRNERSRRAIERIGAKREGIFRNHFILPDGVIRDSVFYSIVESEWSGVKKNLEEMLRR
jgi:N-acetyltransferase